MNINKAVIFDLDGTLLNTIGDIALACNHALNKYKLPTHSENEYKNFVGWGIKTLVTLAMPPNLTKDENFVKKILKEVSEYYSTHWNIKTKPYKDIPELLMQLNKYQIPIAILSNKPQKFTELTVKHYFPDIKFIAIEGEKNGILKPNPETLFPILNKISTPTNNIFFVGDSNMDIQTAIAGNLTPIGVAWGFRNKEELKKAGAKHIVNTPNELAKMLLSNE